MVREDVEALLIPSRHEVPVHVLRFIHVEEVHLLQLACGEERIADEVNDIHEVLHFGTREEVEVAYRSLPCHHRVPTGDRIRREARVDACVLVHDGFLRWLQEHSGTNETGARNPDPSVPYRTPCAAMRSRTNSATRSAFLPSRTNARSCAGRRHASIAQE